MTVGQFDLGDGIIHYEIGGQGVPLVFSHAAFLDSRMFDKQFEAFAWQFRVLRYDMVGYGQSSAAAAPRSRRDDLRRLLEHLGIARAHFVGCSMGGELILDLAVEQPELVASLTLVNATPSGFEVQGDAPRYMYEMFSAIQQGDVDMASELQIRIWFDGMFREPHQVDAELRAKALSMNRIAVMQNTFVIADVQPRNPLIPPAITRLGEVFCPTLIAVGELDHPEVLRAADLMASTIPNAQKVIIAGSAHVPSYEKPEAFNGLLSDFLRSAVQ